MKNKNFNKALYLDTIRQLRKTGLILLIVTLIAVLLPVIIQYFDHIDMKGKSNYVPPEVPKISDIAMFLQFFVFAGGVCFAYSAFSFLNKRNASDFYHVLPNTRACTYTTLAAAVLTWIYAIIIASVLAVWAAYGITGLAFNALYIPYLLLSYLAAATLVASVSMVALSISGTRFTNIVLTGLILFLPRLILFVFQGVVVSEAAIVPAAELGWFFDVGVNLPVGLFLGGLFTSTESILFSEGSILYTFVLSALYLVLGCALFKRRKSELAASSAPGRAWQSVYRCLAALPFLLLAMFFLEDTTVIIVFVVLSLIAYFLYEIITAKRISHFLRVLLQYFAAAAFCVLLALGGHLAGAHLRGIVPDVEEIESVSMKSMQSMSDSYDTVESYNGLLAKGVKVSHPQVKQILHDALAYTVKQENPYAAQGRSYRAQPFTLRLKNGRDFTRWILLKDKDVQQLNELFEQDEQLMQALRKIPAENEIKDVFFWQEIPENKKKEIMSLYMEELAGLSFEQLRYVLPDMERFLASSELYSASNEQNTFVFESFMIRGIVGKKNFESNYHFTPLTPKATNLLLQAIYDGAQPSLNRIKAALPDAHAMLHADVEVVTGAEEGVQAGIQPYYRGSLDYSEDQANIARLLEEMSSLNAPDMTQEGVILRLMIDYNDPLHDWAQAVWYVQIPDDQQEEIFRLFGEILTDE